MARGEGESGIQSHFVERVVKLPMVHVAWDYATNTYTHIKESNKLVNFTLTNAEKSMTFVAGQAKPVVLKFEKQIQAVDDLACKGLGTLEEKVPFITKPAEEIIGDTRKLYTSTVYSRLEGLRQYGRDTIKSVTDYGLGKANALFGNRFVHSMVTSVDGALVISETYIDRILPPTDAEKKSNGAKEDDDKQSSLERLARISRTVRRRAYTRLIIRWENIQERTLDLILTYPLGMIELAKVHIDSTLEFANRLWAALTQQEKEDAEKSQDLSVVTAVKDRVLWILGIIRVAPSLLPMYLYAFVLWLNGEKKTESAQQSAEKEDVKENGTVQQGNNSTDRPCANSNSCNASKRNQDQSDRNSHDTIPEEKNES